MDESYTWFYLRRRDNGKIEEISEEMHMGLTYKVVKDRQMCYFHNGSYDSRYFYELDNPLGISIVDNMLVIPIIF